MKRKVPKFESEDRERDFWSNRDSADYVDWGKAKLMAFPELETLHEVHFHQTSGIDAR